MEKRISGKEFQNFDPIVYSDLRILARTCLLFARAGRLKEEKEFSALIDASEIIAEEWVKHSTRLVARGPQLACNFSETLIDLIKFSVILLHTLEPSSEILLTLCQVANTVQGKLLKKLSVDRNKISYIEFKLLKITIKLQSRLIATKKIEVQLFYSTIINSLEQDNDFVWVHSLRLLQDHLEFIKAEPVESKPAEGAAQVKQFNLSVLPPKKEVKSQDNIKPEGGSAAASSAVPGVTNNPIGVDFSHELQEVSSIKDTDDIAIKSMRLDKAFFEQGMEAEHRKKIVQFSSCLFDLVKRLSEIPVCVPGMIRDGLVYTLLQTILLIYLNHPKDERLRKIAQTYATILRKILASSCEATIKHFGEEACPVEICLRGHNHEILAKNYESMSDEEVLPLVEFFRVFKRNFQMKLLREAIGNYGAFVNEGFQHNASGLFLDWFFDQRDVREPEFVWSVDYAVELKSIVAKQTEGLVYSRKANYSYYLDDFQSVFLKRYTRVGDIFLEPLIATEGYQINDPERLLKKVYFD